MDINDTEELPLTIIFDHEEDEDFNHSLHHNHSDLYTETYHFYGYSVVVPLSLLMVCFIVMAIVGNVLVILTIVRHRGMRTRTNMFIVNLAVADILVAVLDMPVSLATLLDGGWVFGSALCQLNGFTMALFLICSIHTLMYISIHKYISIARPFSRAMTPRRIKMMIVAAWLWAALCATGPLVGWNTITYKKGASQCGPSIPVGTKAVMHSLFITTTNYIIPLAVMSFCYFGIFREIHVHMARIRETSNIDLQSSVAQQKKVSVTLFLVLACFLFCWTPFVLYSTIIAFLKNKEKMPIIANPLAYWFGYMNSACNPVIYAFRSPSFRKGYKEIICGSSASISHVNSMSFRSKSGKGSMKASEITAGKLSTGEQSSSTTRPRKMLSQTSWRSQPLMPFFFRSLSTTSSSSNKKYETRPDSVHSNLEASDTGSLEDESFWLCCSAWKDRKFKRQKKDKRKDNSTLKDEEYDVMPTVRFSNEDQELGLETTKRESENTEVLKKISEQDEHSVSSKESNSAEISTKSDPENWVNIPLAIIENNEEDTTFI